MAAACRRVPRFVPWGPKCSESSFRSAADCGTKGGPSKFVALPPFFPCSSVPPSLASLAPVRLRSEGKKMKNDVVVFALLLLLLSLSLSLSVSISMVSPNRSPKTKNVRHGSHQSWAAPRTDDDDCEVACHATAHDRTNGGYWRQTGSFLFVLFRRRDQIIYFSTTLGSD